MAEYWVVDPDRRTVETWALRDGAADPIMVEAPDGLRWAPGGLETRLEIDLAQLFGSA